MSTANVGTGQCVGNITFGTSNHATCPTAEAANTFSAEVSFLEGPVPAGGGTLTNLEATSTGTPTAGQSYAVDVLDNTTGNVLLSCTVTSSSSPAGYCSNTGTATVNAGVYLEVRITSAGGAPNKAWRVTFRY
jgi:hypothetical protein